MAEEVRLISEQLTVQEAAKKPRDTEGEDYREESNQERKRRGSDTYKQRMLDRMEQTGERLDVDHEIYSTFNKIIQRLRPGVDCDLIITKNNSLEACTLPASKTIITSAGLLIKLQHFLAETHQSEITEDHIALILGHELSHWEPQAGTFHLNETYCDTNAIMMCSKAGFSTDKAVEALAFLEWIEEKDDENRTISDKEKESEHRIPITHPSTEGRRILGENINRDTSIHLVGRSAKPTTLSPNVLNDFLNLSEEWKRAAERCQEITSFDDVKQEFASANTTSQILETFISFDEFIHARISKELAGTPEFARILLASALHAEVPRQYSAMYVDKDDFRALHRSQKIETPGLSRPFALATNNAVPTDINDGLTPQLSGLINAVMEGKYADPLAILTMEPIELAKQYPEFAGINFNRFYTDLTKQVNFFIKPVIHNGTEERANPERAHLFGYDDVLNISDFIEDDTKLKTLAVQRRNLLSVCQTGIASSMVRSVLRDQSNGHNLNNGDGISSICSEVISSLKPDYAYYFSVVTNRLLESGSCQTEAVAMDMAAMIVNNGWYVTTSDLVKTGLWRKNGSFLTMKPRVLSTDDPVILEDARKHIFSLQIALDQGGSHYGTLFTAPSVQGFTRSFNKYCSMLVARDDMSHSSLDPYAIAIYPPSLTIPYTSNVLDSRSEREIDYVTKLFNFDNDPFAEGKCNTKDANTIRMLLLEPANDRQRIFRAVLGNKDIVEEPQILMPILREGVQRKILSPGELMRVISKLNSLELYREFRPFLDGENRAQFEQQWFEEYCRQHAPENRSKAELIAGFVEAGGIADRNGHGNVLGVQVIPYDLGFRHTSVDSKFAIGLTDEEKKQYFREDPEISFADAQMTADRILAYINSPACHHTDEIKTCLRESAANLLRYTLRLSERQNVARFEGFWR
jgi:hypothetical protein